MNDLACYSWVPKTGRNDTASRNVNTFTPQSLLGWSGVDMPSLWSDTGVILQTIFPSSASHSFLLPLATACLIEAGMGPKWSDLVRV